tara:strand:- start:47 stop:496 length:450 start_codon:yes stop_codon:yes gene_type:complete
MVPVAEAAHLTQEHERRGVRVRERHGLHRAHDVVGLARHADELAPCRARRRIPPRVEKRRLWRGASLAESSCRGEGQRVCPRRERRQQRRIEPALLPARAHAQQRAVVEEQARQLGARVGQLAQRRVAPVATRRHFGRERARMHHVRQP